MTESYQKGKKGKEKERGKKAQKKKKKVGFECTKLKRN
jgi:hypothetical protein